jgi:hypothetical protein
MSPRHSYAKLDTDRRKAVEWMALPKGEDNFDHYAEWVESGKGMRQYRDDEGKDGIIMRASAIARTPLSVTTRTERAIYFDPDGERYAAQLHMNLNMEDGYVNYDGKTLIVGVGRLTTDKALAGLLLTWLKITETQEEQSVEKVNIMRVDSGGSFLYPVIGSLYWAIEAAVARRQTLVVEGWKLHEYYSEASKPGQGLDAAVRKENKKAAEFLANIHDLVEALRYGRKPENPVVAGLLEEFSNRIFLRPGRYETALEMLNRLLEYDKNEDQGQNQGQGEDQGQGGEQGKGQDQGKTDKNTLGPISPSKISAVVQKILAKISALQINAITDDHGSSKVNTSTINLDPSSSTTIEKTDNPFFSLVGVHGGSLPKLPCRPLNEQEIQVRDTMLSLLPRPQGERFRDSRFSREGTLDDLRLPEIPLYSGESHPPVFTQKRWVAEANEQVEIYFLYDVSGSMKDCGKRTTQGVMAVGIDAALKESKIQVKTYAFNGRVTPVENIFQVYHSEGGTCFSNALTMIHNDMMDTHNPGRRRLFVFTDAMLERNEYERSISRLTHLRKAMGVETYATIIGNPITDNVERLFPNCVSVSTSFSPCQMAKVVGGMIREAVEEQCQEANEGVRI